MGISLPQAIAALRADLEMAIDETKKISPELTFEVKGIEIELALEVTKKGEGEAAVSWGVIPGFLSGKIKGKGGFSTANTHKISLTLLPRLKGTKGETAEGIIIMKTTEQPT